MSTIRLKAVANGDVVTVKALIVHPMQIAVEKDEKTGQPIPAHFIEEVVCEHKGQVVMTALWSQAISKNPYFSCKFKGGAKGDLIKLSWTDNTGQSDSDEKPIE
jgi:sulfur-oxidizing protein SoxZ